MEQFIRIGEEAPHLGIANLTATHCTVIHALLKDAQCKPGAPRDVRSSFQTFLAAAMQSNVLVLPELTHIGRVQPEQYWPLLNLRDVAYAEQNPTCIAIPAKCRTSKTLRWEHSTLVRHIFLDRLYECCDDELDDPKHILRLTLDRATTILGVTQTVHYDQALLMALYAAILQLELEMRQRHPRYESAIAGERCVNRPRMHLYYEAIAYLKTHIENLLRVPLLQTKV